MHSAKENIVGLDDKRRHLHLLTLQLRLLELELSKINACGGSSSIPSYPSTSRAQNASNVGSIVSIQSGNEASRSGSPLQSVSPAPKLLKSSKSVESNYSGDFDRHPNFLGKSFLLSLADAATQEISRDLEALELETRNINTLLQGKIEALKTETANLKTIKETAKKLDDQLSFKSDQQFFRWLSKFWLGGTERDLRYLKLKIKSDERHQQLKLQFKKSDADVDLLATSNAKMEQQLLNSVASVQKLYEENTNFQTRNKLLSESADKVFQEVDRLQRSISTKRKKTHERGAMKFSLELRNQSLVKHLMDINDATEFNAKKFGLKSIPDIEVRYISLVISVIPQRNLILSAIF
ncbi:Hypothetical predicted protein [Cloeon dipterum]|uniref:DUF4201 domain-containing protein n=1 Tax=Cloeon dipterum TaxID=197152 RepID=A0A8S1D158_9INSE|nr:Hypothetical predicted protein [Cloeon dipterum]